MATYVIGDLQGCHRALMSLLEHVDWQPGRDRLWFAGDLVNRGPDSLACLRWVREHASVTVLGNHDLHLLATAAGHGRQKDSDTLHDILAAPDRAELLDWLRRQPLLHEDGPVMLVHAGLLPCWSRADARRLAAEAGEALSGPDWQRFMARMYGSQPDRWRETLTGVERWRLILNAFTRLRFLRRDGVIDFKAKGRPEDCPDELLPWFDAPDARWREDGSMLLFGHWSALGHRSGPGWTALDSGCLWGGSLTAWRLEDGRSFSHDCTGMPGTRRVGDD